MTIVASIKEHGDHVYITCPVTTFTPDAAEIETFAFASQLKDAAPNPKIMWLKGQYVEADSANRNGDQWTAGELAIKQLTPVLMPITVMHDLRSAVGTIADAKLLTPDTDQVPRARLDTTLAIWAHRFPEIAAECETNAGQSTLMQSMECMSPSYDCSVCGQMIVRDRHWEKTWKEHLGGHSGVLSGDRPPARILRNVTFTGVGLIFGTRGARGAMPDAHLQVEELAAMHREAHSQPKRQPKRRKNTVDIDDSKYEAMVAGRADADSKVTQLTTDVAAKDTLIAELEAKVVTLTEERDAAKTEADTAKETSRVAAMADERMNALGTAFTAKLAKMETTAKAVRIQAGKLADADWTARLVELEELLSVKRDAKTDDKDGKGKEDGKEGEEGKDGKDATAGLLFDKETVATSAIGSGSTQEVTAGEGDKPEPTVGQRQSVMGGLIRPRKKETAKA